MHSPSKWSVTFNGQSIQNTKWECLVDEYVNTISTPIVTLYVGDEPGDEIEHRVFTTNVRPMSNTTIAAPIWPAWL
jgi:hypothetical protein